jgi:hypothetical protein
VLLETLALLAPLAHRVYKEIRVHLVPKGLQGILVPLGLQVIPDQLVKQVLLDPQVLPAIRVLKVQKVKLGREDKMDLKEAQEEKAPKA